jgi:hypothetical protein
MPKRGEVDVRKEKGRLRSRPCRGGGDGARRGEAEARRGEASPSGGRGVAEAMPSRGSGEAGEAETKTR